MLSILPDYHFVAMRLHEELRNKKLLIIDLDFNKAKVFVLEQDDEGKYAVDITAKFAPLFTDEKIKFEDGYLKGSLILGSLLNRCDFLEERSYIIYL